MEQKGKESKVHKEVKESFTRVPSNHLAGSLVRFLFFRSILQLFIDLDLCILMQVKLTSICSMWQLHILKANPTIECLKMTDTI